MKNFIYTVGALVSGLIIGVLGTITAVTVGLLYVYSTTDKKKPVNKYEEYAKKFVPPKEPQRDEPLRRTRRSVIDDLDLTFQGTKEEVLSVTTAVEELLSGQKYALVNDFYDMIGREPQYIGSILGWQEDLFVMRIDNLSDGTAILTMPRPTHNPSDRKA